MKTIRLAILFSGNGSNLENIYTKMQGMVINSSLDKGNSSLTQSSRELEKSSIDRPQVLSHSDFSAQPTNLAQDTRIAERVESNATDSSLRENERSEFSWQSKQNPNANSSIVSEKSGLCSHERGNKTKASIDEASGKLHDLSPQDEFATTKLDFVLAISSKDSAFGIQRCANLGLKCEVVDYKQNKADFIPKIIALLEKNQIDLVVLAGFMRILPPEFTAKFRAINIHPSILPLFKGAHAIKESFESDMKIAGVSVHFVSDELDSGVLILQDIIHKIEGESLENFEARIHELEYEIYPKAIIKAIQMLSNSPLELHSADFGIFGASQTPSLVSAPKIPKNYESQTENPSVVDSLHESKNKKTPSLRWRIADSPKQSKQNKSNDS